MNRNTVRLILFLGLSSFMFFGPLSVQVLNINAPWIRHWRMYRQNIPTRWRLEIRANESMYTSSAELLKAQEIAKYISNMYRRPIDQKQIRSRIVEICNIYKLKPDFFHIYFARPDVNGWSWLARKDSINCKKPDEKSN